MPMRVIKLDFEGNPNIGLFGFCNDSFCLLPKGLSKKTQNKIEKTLDVPCYNISIAGTSLIGAFIAGNNSKIIVPHIIFENEKKGS